MAKSIKVNQKKRGRPATGRDPVSAVRLPAMVTAAVDKWAEEHGASRSEAIRRLIELALGSSQSAKPSRREASATRAAQLADNAIDKVGDPSAHPKERAHRGRRLTKGPEEFREVRVDRSKTKGK